ncbi:MAG: hypothetical protein GC192_18055 [Bacteroidetes bacterium]|nr:hypothetical protein [Bacteroidota bacterium]
MRNLLSISILLLFFAACKNASTNEASEEAATSTTPTTSSETEGNGEKDLCYLLVDGKDTTSVNLKINVDGSVSGTYNWTPWEKDGAYGTLKGRQQGDMLTLLYDYTIEGSNQQEEKVMKLTGDLMAEASGELEEGEGGVLRIKKGAKLSWQPFSKVDCK